MQKYLYRDAARRVGHSHDLACRVTADTSNAHYPNPNPEKVISSPTAVRTSHFPSSTPRMDSRQWSRHDTRYEPFARSILQRYLLSLSVNQWISLLRLVDRITGCTLIPTTAHHRAREASTCEMSCLLLYGLSSRITIERPPAASSTPAQRQVRTRLDASVNICPATAPMIVLRTL